MLRLTTVMLVAFLLGACTLTATLTPTPGRPTRSSAPTSTRPAATAMPNGTATPASGPPLAARHVVSASLNLAQHELQVQQEIEYVNRSHASVTELLLLVEANRKGNVIIERVNAGPTPLVYTLEGRRLVISLAQALQPDAALRLTLAFQVTVPAIEDEGEDYLGWFGYSPRQLNLGNWLPVVAAMREGSWLAPEAAEVGEHAAQELAAWEVSLFVEDAPAELVVVGPGAQTQEDAQRWHFSVPAARDFTLSIGAAWQIAETTFADDGVIELYSLEESVRAQGAAAYALDIARRSMERFSDLFGPPALPRLAVVEGDFPDGMEFSGVVFVSQDWFDSWTGDPASFLTIISAHEVAHQWWYASVANDQAREPWLDEALATYSELLLLEADMPELVDWWWDWRIDRFAPAGFVDSEVYDFAVRRPYINAVYLQGARMFHALRQDLGDEAFFSWLRQYAEAGAGKIVSAAELWALLDDGQLAATRATRQRFLREPGP